jgi:hypothetical protein
MVGIADDLKATRRHVLGGTCSESYALDQVDMGHTWLNGLGARISSHGFADEVNDVSIELAELKEAIRIRFPPKVVRLLWVPTRRREELPSVEVLRYDQGWVQRTRRKRARVEVAYELLIGGQHVLIGSRRYVMRQAYWAAMCDAFGKLPELERLTGLAKRRALYKARKARRKPVKRKANVRWRKSNYQRSLERLGGVMATSIMNCLMRPSALEGLLVRYPAGR